MPPNSTPGTSSDDDIDSIPTARTHSSKTSNRNRTVPKAGSITEYIPVGKVLALFLIVLFFNYMKAMITGPALSLDSDSSTIGASTATIKSTRYTSSSTAFSNQRSHENSDDSSSNPLPNFTYVIRASSSGKFLASNSGAVTLVGPRSGKNPSVYSPLPLFHAELILDDSGNASKSKDGSIFRTPLPAVSWDTISGMI
ncbi:hypothetical protein BOTNAR_0465g00040 [Botryotinia narcissicola]|uniref:Uncharacterized protein n=1 Tax=Botryotinia narcissicola TaxID=278944 RepID=A0A4Z1HHZ7_9HELO|nr:hypothetical protein BOTNAR_0465g00040 [Botryotinia narcissicola]